MSFPAGKYTITSLAGNPVGRFPIEDGLDRPKRILSLPKDFEKPMTLWQIEEIADGKYKLKANLGYVGKLSDNLVWAFLHQDEVKDGEWRITHVPQHGKHAYIIQVLDERTGEGWVASEEDNSQVAVKPLVATMSIPPFFLHTEVFNIVHVPDSE